MEELLFAQHASHAIDQTLDAYFKKAFARSSRISPSYRRLWGNLHDLMRAGGKRLRPKITLLAYEAFGGRFGDGIVSVAVAQEFLHFCLLIHDDIIDRDVIRYGVPNITGRYQAAYQAYLPDVHEHTHFAHSAAILGGDLMLSAAYELVATSNLQPAQILQAQRLLTESTFNVAGGELLDTEASFTPYTPGDALKIAEYKTARYSFVTPLLLGAALADSGQGKAVALTKFGTALGIAYQLVDDLLGVFGNEDETGKSNFGDIREGKRTYLVERAMEAMSTDDKILFGLAFGNTHATAEAINQAKSLLISTGAKAETEQLIARYKKQALQAIPKLALQPVHARKFEALITYVTERTS